MNVHLTENQSLHSSPNRRPALGAWAWAVGVFLLCSGVGVEAWAADTDQDGLEDGWELQYFGNLDQGGQGDPDNDTLTNVDEQRLGGDPTKIDTDGDFLRDAEEVAAGTKLDEADSDGDGLSDFAELKGLHTNPLKRDTDDGGTWDGVEVILDGTDPKVGSDDLLDADGDGLTFFQESLLGTSDLSVDSDGDGLTDDYEDSDRDGVVELDADGDGQYTWFDRPGIRREELNPANSDTDGDGLNDGMEVNTFWTNPYQVDTDGDGLEDGAEYQLRLTLYPCLDPALADSDLDGLTDDLETKAGSPTDPCDADSDDDGIYDSVELFDGTDPRDPASKLTDTDGDGLTDSYEDFVGSSSVVVDTDGDGLSDAEEVLPLADRQVTNPTDADTDDDGILDGDEGGFYEKGAYVGGTMASVWDTEGDGLSDGLELGYAAPEVALLDPDATNLQVFLPDLDSTTTTNPNYWDSDSDLLSDREEDLNRNGRVDAGESDPKLYDTDGDGMDDRWEVYQSTQVFCDGSVTNVLDPLDPTDASEDPDGDGLTNLEEYRLNQRNEDDPWAYDGPQACVGDTDGDGLMDGLEENATYWVGNGSDPDKADTDKDGLSDGTEDRNKNGLWDEGTETNPLIWDTDADGLSDGAEDRNGDHVQGPDETDPLDPDSDKDGLLDGLEVNGLNTNPLSKDSDGDGLDDGLEFGQAPDVDPSSVTNPAQADTDADGVADGVEDADQNGRVDPGETDPNNPDSDGDGLLDGEEDRNANGKVDDGETNPLLADTDLGGVLDGVEVKVDGTDPLDPNDDRVSDADHDGLLNFEEALAGTDPANPDSDGDTIGDLFEVGDVSHPVDTDSDGLIDALDTDSDGDGVADIDEAGDADLLTDPVDSDGDGVADFRELDSDNGGVDDGTEVRVHGTDPTNPLDDGQGWLDGEIAGGACAIGHGGVPLGLLWVLGLVVSGALILRQRRKKGR